MNCVDQDEFSKEFPCDKAERVTLACIKTVNFGESVSKSEFLKLVQSPRLLCEGDIIPVPVNRCSYLDYHQLISKSSPNKPGASPSGIQTVNNPLYDEVLQSLEILEGSSAIQQTWKFYKVLHIDTEKKTTPPVHLNNVSNLKMAYTHPGVDIYEETSVNSALPLCIESYITQEQFKIPPGKHAEFQQLFSILGSYFALSSRMQTSRSMACSVLLHGIRSNGKRLILRKVCQYLGVHLLEINCFEILGQADTQTTDGLYFKFNFNFNVI
jgi:hypothetical protein